MINHTPRLLFNTFQFPLVCYRLLQNNQVSGPIPAEIGKLSELQTLDLSGNLFVGEIPSSLGFLTRLSYL